MKLQRPQRVHTCKRKKFQTINYVYVHDLTTTKTDNYVGVIARTVNSMPLGWEKNSDFFKI